MRRAVRFGLALIFLISAALHLSAYPLFSFVEAVGALGLASERFHRRAAVVLILFLVVSFPFLAPAMSRSGTLWWRTPVHLVWIAAVGWSAKLMRRAGVRPGKTT